MNTNDKILKEFRETFKHSQFVNYSAIESFLIEKLNQVREETAREIMVKIESLEPEINEELYGWDMYPKSDKQARAVIKLIKESFPDSREEKGE